MKRIIKRRNHRIAFRENLRYLRKIYTECGSAMSEIRFQLKENRRVRRSGARKPPRTPALVETKSDAYPPSLVDESDVAPPKLVDGKPNSTEFDGKLAKLHSGARSAGISAAYNNTDSSVQTNDFHYYYEVHRREREYVDFRDENKNSSLFIKNFHHLVDSSNTQHNQLCEYVSTSI